VAVVCAACASAHPAISTGGASRLGAQVAQVRATAASGDMIGAAQQVATIRRTVADLLSSGQLSPSRAASILSAADEVDAQLKVLTTTTTSTTTTSPPTTVPSKHGVKRKGGDGGGPGGGQGGD
jgi:hypothetical protein